MSRLGGFLQGIRVIDLSRHLPGPLATLILADLGAEVLKVEPPAGDEMRSIGGTAEEPSAYFRAVNAGKSTCTLDLKTEAGRMALETMIAGADVLVESFRPGIMSRLGLPPERLRALNPGLITCALSGFGQSGPLHDRAGHDLNYLALTGLLSAMAPPGGATAVRYPPMADVSASFMAAIAILGALQGRARTGQGAVIDLALADAAFPQFVFTLADLGTAGTTGPAGGAGALLGGGAAFYDTYPVTDGTVTLAAIEPKFWRAFCAAAGRPDWLPRHGEAFPQHALTAEIAALFAGMTLAQAVARFEPADCCFAPVLDLPEALADGHVACRGLVQAAEDGLIQALFPALVDGEPPALRAPLRELGDGLALAAANAER